MFYYTRLNMLYMNKLKIKLLCGQARYYEKINVYNPDIYTWKHKNNIAYFSSWNNLGQLTISNDDIYKYIDFFNIFIFLSLSCFDQETFGL